MAVSRSREVRLGLVLNGGVSLAVWIGGVTREIDAARRSSAGSATPADTSELYGQILEVLDDELIVDVIAGASAGGINGVLLGAAIYNHSALDALQETWLSLGDFRKLLRSPALPDPPSLMKGDDVVLTELQKVLAGLWGDGAARPAHPLYVYVTATDLFGFPADFADSRGATFEERDHRRVFSFEHEPSPVEPSSYTPARENVMRPVVRMEDPDARALLARAARSSSSFPVAFESHKLSILDDGTPRQHWMVDGGILDNQPFNPVLDRVAVLPADKPVRRAVVYVVPYATDVGSTPLDATEPATARDTYMAAGSLPRDLPRLQSLERITREGVYQDAAEAERRRILAVLDPDNLTAAANALFSGYKAARFAATQSVFELWAKPEFRPGDGAIAQHPADDPRDLLRAPRTQVELRDVPWIPDSPVWGSDAPRWHWDWGLSPAERVATWALLFLRDAAEAAAADGERRARDLFRGCRRRLPRFRVGEGDHALRGTRFWLQHWD